MDVDYRSILKRYMAYAISNDCVIALNNIYYATKDDKLELCKIGLEIAEDEDDNQIKIWMNNLINGTTQGG